MTFGEKLMRLRKAKGMTQEELAERITVSRQAISRWEAGETMPDSENLLQLTRLFGVSADYLLNEEYETDRDIPAVRENASAMKRQQKLQIAFLYAVGIGAIAVVAGIVGWRMAGGAAIWVMLAAVIIYIAAIMYFKTIMFKCAKDEEEIRRWKRKLIRTYIWFIMAFPGGFTIEAMVGLYPRPMNGVLYMLLEVLLYLVICGGVTWALRERRPAK